jgi:predicted GIY-YIG superfamily endonuclease
MSWEYASAGKTTKPRRRKRPFPAALFQAAYSGESSDIWYVYVIQSLIIPPGKKVGYTYVGCTNNPARRLEQHNGSLPGGARYTSKWRPWRPRALFGPFKGRTEALKAEYALKHGKRGEGRVRWSSTDSKWCRGLGPDDPWVTKHPVTQ